MQKGEVVLDAPIRAIYCLDTVPTSVRRRLERAAKHASTSRLSLQGLLAAALFLDEDEDDAESFVELRGSAPFDKSVWAACAPTIDSLRDGFPLLWPQALQDLVPGPVAEILNRQKRKLDGDWAAVRKLLASTEPTFSPPGAGDHSLKDQYTHAWLLINSRTFDNVTASTERYPPDERLALIPLADLFNHTTLSSSASSSSAGTVANPRRGPVSAVFHEDKSYTFTATRAIPAGDEVCISYGEHSNDFLLAEYGFFFASSAPGEEHNGANSYDSISLSEALAPLVTADQKASARRAYQKMAADGGDGDGDDEYDTKDTDVLGDCALSLVQSNGIVMMLSPRLQLLLGVLMDKEVDGASLAWLPCPMADSGLLTLLRKLLDDIQIIARGRLESLRPLMVRSDASPAVGQLAQRWQQIDRTVAMFLKVLSIHIS